MYRIPNQFTLIPLLFLSCFIGNASNVGQVRPPNILFAISDDQSFAHTSFEGCKFINTPAFDRVAREGVYFANCMAGSPGCAPSRSAIVTGRYPWQNEQSGQHASSWLKKFVPFIDILNKGGYATGRTGKGVEPFQYARDKKDSLWRRTNAAGIAHSNLTYDESGNKENGFTTEMSNTDYFGNFKYFMENVTEQKPFFFWYGGREPHRNFEKGSWRKTEKKLEEVSVPGFLPDNEEVRGDLLDYSVEVEWFDLHLKKMLDYLEEIGELENTIVIVTSDNGKAFPRAKANGYEYGIHVPMAIRYPKKYVGGRIIEDPISFVDLAPTILEIAEEKADGMMPVSGRSFLDLLVSKEQGVVRSTDSYALSGRERHSSSRYKNMGYPQRTIRSKDYLYIWNMRPERWPAGAPQMYSPNDTTLLLPRDGVGPDGTYYPMSAFTDVDESPSKQIILENAVDADNRLFYNLSFGKRPEFELYDIRKDPACLNNLVGRTDLSDIESKLKNELVSILTNTNDSRVVGPDTEIFDSYLRYSPMRKFPQPNN
ncbi:sulfatase family protein [Zobellia alginiliquefaciens]|uniref:sulfatase family protein n=1 Tax=Zobellia alginiliquefaciens TaxID=3032586 RepID=UPI0023E38794|nr:sulfatase [Zobellia alginiliquefaciens]